MSERSILIGPNNYPNILRAFAQIDLENGGKRRFKGDDNPHCVPGHWNNWTMLELFDSALERLSQNDLELLCNGEREAKDSLVERFGLRALDLFLDDYFDGWIGGPT